MGGAQRYVATLARELAPACEVTVAAYGPGPLAREVAATGARYVALRHVRRAISPWRDLLGLIELVQLCRRVRPDILHANSSKAGVLGRLAALSCGVPVRIFTVHGWAFSAHSGVRAATFRALDRLAGLGTTMTVCVSTHDLRAGLAARTCRAGRAIVIHNAADVHASAPRPRDGGAPRVLSVGRLQAPKDPVTLVRALARLRPGSFQAHIVGSGPQLALVQQEVERTGAGPAIELLGERRDVPELLGAADVFVLSSRSEGLPFCVLEAMAAGVPVVATAVGGVDEEVVDGVTGFLVAPGDPAALADRLQCLLEDPALRRRMGAAARERACRHFAVAAFGKAHRDLYGNLLRPDASEWLRDRSASFA